jgi:hypothetical protein
MNVYSKLLGEITVPSIGINTIGGPPVGTVWVVKDMTVQLPDTFIHSALGFYIQDTAGAIIFSVVLPWAMSSVCYEWKGSQLIEPGTYLELNALEASWHVRVTGYELTLP